MTEKLCGSCAHWKRVTDAFDLEYHGPSGGSCSNEHFMMGCASAAWVIFWRMG